MLVSPGSFRPLLVSLKTIGRPISTAKKDSFHRKISILIYHLKYICSSLVHCEENKKFRDCVNFKFQICQNGFCGLSKRVLQFFALQPLAEIETSILEVQHKVSEIFCVIINRGLGLADAPRQFFFIPF